MPKDVSGMGFGHGPVAGVLIILVAATICFLKASRKDVQQPQAQSSQPAAAQTVNSTPWASGSWPE
ncbi:MAG TPA: hypothetical protein VHZ03_46820 [Trebonia sp.]|jgi:hypothetical protein|nr:hypothetical protein [Trebonia sp.]